MIDQVFFCCVNDLLQCLVFHMNTLFRNIDSKKLSENRVCLEEIHNDQYRWIS